MTRKSKHELWRELENLESDLRPTGSRRNGDTHRLEDGYPDSVITFFKTVHLNLLRICHRNPETVVNVEDPVSAHNFLALVRKKYDIDDDRDDAVQAKLEEKQAGWMHSSADAFASFIHTMPKYASVTTDDGKMLAELVDAGRQAEAEHTLVSTVYDLLADAGANTESESLV